MNDENATRVPPEWRPASVATSLLVLAGAALFAAGCNIGCWFMPCDNPHPCEPSAGAVVRFRGTVHTIEPLGERGVDAWGIGDVDRRFLVSIRVEAVELRPSVPRGDVVKKGATLDFAVHSPAHALGADAKVGSTLDLELGTLECDGVFRGFSGLRPATAARTEGLRRG